MKESELAGRIHERVKAQQEKLHELRVKMDKLEIEQLRGRFEALAEKHPESKEEFEKLRSIAEKNVILRYELEELHKQGREMLESIDLEPEQAKELSAAFGHSASGIFRQMQEHVTRKKEHERLKKHFERKKPKKSKRVEKIERMLKDQEERFEKMKDQDPEMYELMTEEREMLEEIMDLKQELMDMFHQHLRSEER